MGFGGFFEALGPPAHCEGSKFTSGKKCLGPCRRPLCTEARELRGHEVEGWLHAREAWSWGYSRLGGLGHGDGSLYHEPVPRLIAGVAAVSIVQASCSERHTLLLSHDGHVYSCGDGLGGRLGHGDAASVMSPKMLTIWQKPMAVMPAVTDRPAETAYGAGGLTGSGTGSSQTRIAPSSLRARAVAGSLEFDALASIEALTTPPRVCCIAAGEAHSLACTLDGHVYSWGLFAGGRLGLRKAIVAESGLH